MVYGLSTGARFCHADAVVPISSMPVALVATSGHSNISVTLVEPGYEFVSPASKRMKIVEKLLLVPSYPICILPLGRFDYVLYIGSDSSASVGSRV